MKYTTYRYWFKYGNEEDPIECTTKYWDSLDKAINYAHRYATGVKFESVEIEDENGNLVYRLDSNGVIEDYRETTIEINEYMHVGIAEGINKSFDWNTSDILVCEDTKCLLDYINSWYRYKDLTLMINGELIHRKNNKFFNHKITGKKG